MKVIEMPKNDYLAVLALSKITALQDIKTKLISFAGGCVTVGYLGVIDNQIEELEKKFKELRNER